MNKSILATGLFTASLAIASCTSAQTENGAPSATASATSFSSYAVTAGEAVELPEGSPFTAASYGTFKEPWGIAIEPGTSRLFFTEKGGTAKFLTPSTGTIGEISGLPSVAYGGQGGLGDIAFAPDYETSGYIYLSWAEDASADFGEGARKAVAGRGKLVCSSDSACAVEGLAKIWEHSLGINSAGHFSHKMTFSPDGTHLFISAGERMQGEPAQDLTNNLGTIVRLLPDGTPAPGNPFADQGSPTDQIWSYGHRNLYGLHFDSDGQLWDLEHGPRGGDELNNVQKGANYGWPVVSDGVNYNGDPIPDHDTRPEFSKPAISWDPVIAPGDFIFYSGDMFADWKGQILVANLGTTSISRISTSADKSSATEDERYDMGNRLRDIIEAEDGSLWVLEDGPRGRLLRLTPKS